jgi:hypothetical protein
MAVTQPLIFKRVAAVRRCDAGRAGIETPDRGVRALPDHQRRPAREFSAPWLPWALKLEPATTCFGF